MPPILNTFSKNQFDVLASTGGTNVRVVSSSSTNDDGAAKKTSTTFDELTKDLMMRDDESVEDENGEALKLSQDLDWGFGENKDDDDDDDDDGDNDASSTHKPTKDDKLDTFDSQDDIDSDLEEDQQKTPPSSGRKKATLSKLQSKEEKAKEEDEGEKSSSDDSDDERTIDMSDDDQQEKAVPAESKAKEPKPSSPSKDHNTTHEEEDEDSDAWLDGSGDEEKAWRDRKIYSDDEESGDEEKANGDSFENDETEMPLADSENEESQSGNGSEIDASEAVIGDDELEGKSEATPRRSVRSRKTPTVYSDSEESPRTNAAKKVKVPPKKVWEAAVDELFLQIDNAEEVTIKQFLDGLREKFGCKIGKKWKDQIKLRVKGLLERGIKPNGAEEEEEEEDADDEASIAASDASDYEDDAQATRSKRRSSTKGRSTRAKSARPKKLNKRIAARAAKVMAVQKERRKQRMEELKVRNEEMQLQSKEDVERADAIAAKFETNTDELRLKRLEDRLDLLQQLDRKRISVVKIKEEIETEIVEPPVDDSVPKEESESDESSSEEEDLVIVGMKKRIKPLKPLQNHLPSSALEVLNSILSPVAKQKVRYTKSEINANGAGKNGMITSPGKSMGARFALRNALKQKQRKAGNLWLARELGYKKEEDHLKDCQAAAEQKREIVLKLEQERLMSNERKQLRERLLLQEASEGMDQEDIAENAEDTLGVDGEEEDEEMQMAKAIERESSTSETVEEDKSAENHDESEECDETKVQTPQDRDSGEMAEESVTEFEDCANDLEQQDAQEDMKIQPPSTFGEQLSAERKNNAAMDDATGSDDDDIVKEHSCVSEKDSQPFESQPSIYYRVTKENEPCESSLDNSQGTESHRFETQPPLAIDGEKALTEDSVVTPDKDAEGFSENPKEEEATIDDVDGEAPETTEANKRPKNILFQEALRREAERLKKQQKKKGDLVEEEAEEEEEEEVAGLEDFGFTVSMKSKDDDNDDDANDQLDEDDLEHIVDEVSDGEGDEEAGMAARRKMEAAEEKQRHKEFLRRAREGHDGRRGGIAGGSSGARGLHGFDQLVAPDNREAAKALGLLNDDEMESDDDEEKEEEEEDELALLDKDLRRRHLQQSDVNVDEDLSSDDEEEELEIGDRKFASCFFNC
jgi:hypothetical protein